MPRSQKSNVRVERSVNTTPLFDDAFGNTLMMPLFSAT